MSPTIVDEEEVETRLRELVKLTDHLDIPRVFRCEWCGSQLDEDGADEPCGHCQRKTLP